MLTNGLDREEFRYLQNLRRTFHKCPELGFEEHDTATRVEEELHGIGQTTRRWCGTGITTVFEGTEPGPTLLLRADLDALPIQEENTHEYRSERAGVMHACGHDAHTAILIGVARKLCRETPLHRGRIVLLFQPAEEGRHGAEELIKEGILDSFSPDLCAGLHVWSEAPTGICHVTEGPFMASTNRFVIRLQGKGGHGAVPHTAKDPIVAGARLILALQTLVSREVSPAESAVITVGQIHAGNAFNIIPDTLELEGTLRTFNKDVQRTLETRIREMANGVALSAGMSAQIEMERIALPTVNAPKPTALMQSVVKETPGVSLGSPGFQTMAGEDISFFLDAVPGVFFFLGAQNDAVGASFPHHHPRFEIDEEILPLGVELLSRFAHRVLAGEGL